MTQITETQRFELESVCVRAFTAVVEAMQHTKGRWPLTVVVFDYGQQGHVAYVTGLEPGAPARAVRTRGMLVNTFEALLARFKQQKPVDVSLSVLTSLPTPKQLTDLLQAAQAQLPQDTGIVLVCGEGALTHYISTAERAQVARVIEDDLLPKWRAGVVSC